jgi:diguanylate cyclase (GGDEF)-like protein
MLHIPTLLFALSLTDVVLATTLLVALGLRAPGVRAWSASLVLQAASFATYALRDPAHQIGLVVLVNGTAALSFTMQADALLTFHGRSLRRAWHVVAPILAVLVLASLSSHARARLVVNALACSVTMIAIAAIRRPAHDKGRRLGVGLVRAGLLAGALVMALRAAFGLVDTGSVADLRGWSSLGVSITLLADAVTIVCSLGFLLMHRERQEQAIEKLAMTDPLTGAYNRRTLFDLGQKEIERALRRGSAVSVVIFDLDHFKLINDTHGHMVGDAVLARFVDVARGCLRRGDLLTRYGGEEFCVLLPHEPAVSPEAVAERIRAAVEASPFDVDGRTLRITASAGVATSHAETAATLSSLVRSADEALYAAKRDGRNRVVVATPGHPSAGQA